MIKVFKTTLIGICMLAFFILVLLVILTFPMAVVAILSGVILFLILRIAFILGDYLIS